jgi:hypothetical protein
MWPFKSNIPFVESIFTEEDGELITIIHEKGAHKFRREEIIELLVISDNFSVFLHDWIVMKYTGGIALNGIIRGYI